MDIRMLRCLTIGLVVSLVGLLASPAAAETYESEDFAYSIDIPEGWESRTQETVPAQFRKIAEKFRKLATKDASEAEKKKINSKMDLVLGPADVSNPAQPPFAAFIGVTTPENLSVSGVRDSMTTGLKKAMKSNGVEPNVRNGAIVESLKDASPGDILVDDKYAQVAALNKTGPVEMLVWMKAGAEKMVIGMFLDQATNWANWKQARMTMAKSFKMDEQARIDPDWAQRIGKFLFPFVLLIGGIVWWWRREDDDEQASPGTQSA